MRSLRSFLAALVVLAPAGEGLLARRRPGARRERELELKLARGVRVENLGVAAFLQDPDSMRIHAAASVRPGARALARGQ